MKASVALMCMAAILFLTVAWVEAEEEHQTPTAPAEFLAMENPYDVDDVDDDFLKAGKKIYKRKCKKCHGTDGDGQGSAADDIEIKPTAFDTAGYFDDRPDGQLYWIMLEGSEGTEMEAFGPGTDVNLSEDDIWKLVTYLRSSFAE